MSSYIFFENQYLGLNRMSLTRRMSLAIFCFLAYYFNSSNLEGGDLYFFIGIIIIVISIPLLFILHFQTKIENGSIILDGLWTARKVKIDISSLVASTEVTYSKFILNRSVYNLHRKGTIRFYTRGKEAVSLEDKDGLIYLIGSQKASELNRVINSLIKNNT
jgi:hypothetical protein|tara:strand:- start:1277 stop:1762 length:486 start_codon:yes stop_codon:yes gene_type:complete